MSTKLWIVVLVIGGALAQSDSGQRGTRQALDDDSGRGLAIRIVKSGLTAGMVLSLPRELHDRMAQRERVTSGFLMERSAFGLWLEAADQTESEGQPLLRSSADVQMALGTLASRPGVGGSVSASTGNVPNFVSTTAPLCQQALRSQLRSPVSEKLLPGFVLALVRSSTSAKVPGGIVGSCMGATDSSLATLAIEKGVSLHDALNMAVGGTGSAVWVAVQTESGQCSLGLVRQAKFGGGVCATAITADLHGRSTR